MAPARSNKASSMRASSSGSASSSSRSGSTQSTAPSSSTGGLRLSKAPARPPPPQQPRLAFTRQPGPVLPAPPPPQKRVKIQSPERATSRPTPSNGFPKGKEPLRGSPDLPVAAALWSSRYRPTKRSELAVHLRKTVDVETWLREAFSPSARVRKHRRILILRGPAGAGKTETIRQLGAPGELDYEVLEWKNEVESAATSMDDWRAGGAIEGIMERFCDFISQSAKFPTLALTTERGVTASSSSSSSSASTSSPTLRRQLILLEDLPTLSHYATLQSFQQVMATFLSRPLAQDPNSNVPIVLILSNTASGSGGGVAGDSGDPGAQEDGAGSSSSWMTTRKLLGAEAEGSDGWYEIKFNPVAVTILSRVLKETYERAVGCPLPPGIKSKGKSASLSRRVMPVEVVEALAESTLGDVRSAIDLLQQVHSRFIKQPRRFERVAQSRTKTKAKEEARKVMVELGLMSRESALDIFHALGKVLFNKRVGDPELKRGREEMEVASDDEVEEGGEKERDKEKPLLLPAHLSHLWRRKSKVNIESLSSSSTGVDSSLLSLWVAHNYPPFTTDIEQCALISDSFSFVESSLNPSYGEDLRALASNNAQHPLLLSHYAGLITFGSTLLHLPSPVPRKGQKMTRPSLWEVNERSKALRGDVEALQDDYRSRRRAQGSSCDVGIRTATPRQVAEEWGPSLAKMAAAAAATGDARGGWSAKQKELLARVGGMDWRGAFSQGGGTGVAAAAAAQSRDMDADDAGDLGELVEEDQGGAVKLSGQSQAQTQGQVQGKIEPEGRETRALDRGGGVDQSEERGAADDEEGGDISDDPIED
ncbi:hypothetical protein BDZ90DRAFT_231255 [Jaminaea rosea]|uniref:Rad17-domain-containing protein n=1 Tax=Jaminaea rosea TaxID=1569628 RepID=A0A316USK4_9BASI|nr:hypothetical protein BDZ90DRAFT_231255 [Jaminaea rosea]PWN28260.1 hypothetical protein BDZ90DRAFT_231255 [Jaminaea rosea]